MKTRIALTTTLILLALVASACGSAATVAPTQPAALPTNTQVVPKAQPTNTQTPPTVQPTDTQAPPAAQPTNTLTPPTVQPTDTQPAAPSGGEVDITIAGFAFSPKQVTVKVGTTVKWVNEDSTSHSVTSDSGAWDSATLGEGDQFTHTFDQEGTFAYHCAFHSSMTGTIVVTK